MQTTHTPSPFDPPFLNPNCPSRQIFFFQLFLTKKYLDTCHQKAFDPPKGEGVWVAHVIGIRDARCCQYRGHSPYVAFSSVARPFAVRRSLLPRPPRIVVLAWCLLTEASRRSM